MEDQGKRLLIAVAAAMGIFLVWMQIFPSKKDDAPKDGSGSAVVQPPPVQNPIGQPVTPAAVAPAPVAVGSGSGSGSGSAVAAPVAAAPARPSASPGLVVHPRDAADEIAFDTTLLHADFSKWGGNLVSWKLKDERYQTAQGHGELVLAEPLGGSAFDVNFASSSLTIPPNAVWQGKRNGNVITYVYSDDKLTITKTYTLYPQDYLIKLDVALEAKAVPSGQTPVVYQQQLAISIYGFQDPKLPIVSAGRTKREWSAACVANGGLEKKPIHELHEAWNPQGVATWAGVDHPYFLLAMAPREADSKTILCSAYPVGTGGLIQVALLFPPNPVKSGEVASHQEVWAYVGPKYVSKLESADETASFKTGFGKSVTFGRFSIRFIALPLLWLLQQFYALVGNWGLAIILLTILVKLATLYWTTKSMRSMRAMAALKPKMDELNKKYKDDRARQQQEMMALYKQHGVNPLAGCLPILLQMPIWMALYGMLSAAGELYNAPFIPGWIDDLTAQDPYYILGIALVILMFVQAKLQPATGDGMQQKMMMYGLPAVFGFFSLFFPSGLTLYILTNTILTALHSLYMRKYDKSAKLVPAFAAAAAAKSAARDVAKPAPARRADPIDIVADERVDDDSDDDEGDDADDDAGAGGKAPAGKPSDRPSPKTTNRPRRGQRRKGRN